MSPAAPLLAHLMQPLAGWLAQTATEDIAVQQPGECWIRQAGEWIRDDVDLDLAAIEEISILAGALREQEVGPETPLCATELPDGERLQICLPPTVPTGSVSLVIRKFEHGARDLSHVNGRYRLNDWHRWRARHEGRDLSEPLARYDAGDFEGFLRAAVRGRLNILLVGAVGAGKTTLSKSLLKALDPGERIITIEDTLELAGLPPNHVRLLYSKDRLSGADVGPEDLLQASLRMRPDRIMLQELRDGAAFTYVSAIVSGHPGSITTIHGHGAAEAFRRLFVLAKSSPQGAALDDATLSHLLSDAIDVIVPLAETGGVFSIGSVWFVADATRRGEVAADLLRDV